MIETVTWKLGGTADYTSASNFYGYERGTTVYSGRPTMLSGKVALMYPSDYGYATSGGTTTNRTLCLATDLYSWSSLSDCYNNDWLFNSAVQWALTPRSSSWGSVFGVSNYGFLSNYSTNNNNMVRPSIYLKSNITISGGDGTSSNPYRIS